MLLMSNGYDGNCDYKSGWLRNNGWAIPRLPINFPGHLMSVFLLHRRCLLVPQSLIARAGKHFFPSLFLKNRAMRTKWLVRVPHKNLKWGNDLAKNQLKISYLISFSIQTLFICQDKTSDNYLLSMDSRAWLIAIPPPAITPTELAVHWGCECVSSNWTVVPLMLPDPLRIQVRSPICPADCFSPPKLCQGLVRELCSHYLPVVTLDQRCPPWLSHLHPGCTGFHFCSSSSREPPKYTYQCGLLHIYHAKALAGCRGRGKWRGRKQERPSSSEGLGIWDP